MTPLRAEKIKQVLAKRQPDLTVITDHVHKGRNLAAIVRTADAVGVGEINAVLDIDTYFHFGGTAKGSHHWVDVCLHHSLELALKKARQANMQIVVATKNTQAVPYYEYDFCRPTALLMGAELMGVSDMAQREADAFVYVPMVGMVESLNVSVAAAVILNEAQRQRREAGFYDTQRIDEKTWQRLFFKWGYERLAKFCDARDIPYPPIDSNGDIDDPESQWRTMAKTLEQ